MTDNKIKSALDAAGTAADYSARATYQRGYDAGVASVASERDAAIARAEAAEARESETMRGLDVAIARADAAEQMAAELRAVLVKRHAHDVAGGICDTPERCSCDDDVTAILAQAAPIDGRWCLASERDAAIADAAAVMSSIYESLRDGEKIDPAVVDIGIGCWLEKHAPGWLPEKDGD
jgi:hypothetical protein